MESTKKFYVTTSIAYANSVPHIGYAMEVAEADALARYHALKLGRENVFFLSGTDEHGTKIKKTATEKGMEVKAFADQNVAVFKQLLTTLNCDNDKFIRTTDPEHEAAAQKLWTKLVEAGDIYEKTYEGKYCVGCEEFLTEKVLSDGKCPYHLKEPETVAEKNYFFNVTRHLPEIKKRIESGEFEVIPESRKHEILNLIDSADKESTDVSFSRQKNVLDWGVPVPGDDDQVMYVWCDALANYISALSYAQEDDGELFKKFWPADMHIIGKDILRFHAMLWPAMLLSAGLPLPKKICVHSHITSGGQKMSKSLGNVIDPFAVVEKYGVEPARYFLLKEIPTTEDGDFSFERFEEVYKSDLQNGLGNLVARVLAMTEKYFDGKVPEVDRGKTGAEMDESEDTARMLSEYMERFKLDRAAGLIQTMVTKSDGYITDTEPFKLIKTDPEATAVVIYNLLENLRQLAWLTRPFLPATSDKIFEQLFADEDARREELKKTLDEALVWGGIKAGTRVAKGEALFPRLEEQA